MASPRRSPNCLLPSVRPRIVVTFDDGYADNLINALPIAEAKGVPITIFVTSGVLGSRSGFWWDRLGTLLRSRVHLQSVRSPCRQVKEPSASDSVRLVEGRTSSRCVATYYRFR